MRTALIAGYSILFAIILLELFGACAVPLIQPMPPAPLLSRPDSAVVVINGGLHGLYAYGGYGIDSTIAVLAGFNYITSVVGVEGRDGYGAEIAVGRYKATSTMRAEVYGGIGAQYVSVQDENYSIFSPFVQGNLALSTDNQVLLQLGLSARLSYFHLWRYSFTYNGQQVSTWQGGRDVILTTFGPFARVGGKKVAAELGAGLNIPFTNPYLSIGIFSFGAGVRIQF